MKERIAEVSPRLKARMAGVFYLLTELVAFDEFSVLGRLVVHDNPAATAANILAHQLLFRVGFAAQIIATHVRALGSFNALAQVAGQN